MNDVFLFRTRIGKRSIKEHMQGSDSNPLTAGIDGPALRLLIPPSIPRPRVQQHRHKEEVYQAADLLLAVVSLLIPLLEQLADAVYTAHVEMLPPTVRRDEVIPVGAEIALCGQYDPFLYGSQMNA